jgi:ankyrin repeat protein
MIHPEEEAEEGTENQERPKMDSPKVKPIALQSSKSIRMELENQHELEKKMKQGYLTSLFESEETKKFRLGRILVEAQTKQHRSQKLFRMVCEGNEKDFYTYLSQGLLLPEKVRTPDKAGATIIHIAYLYQNFHLGRKLVTQFPKESLLRYGRGILHETEMPYYGENILHMAIVHRNYDEVKWLLQFYRNCGSEYLTELMSARCLGHFFHPHRGTLGVYFGEYPIHFAVCSNNIEILDMLIEFHPEALFFVDRHGNNALHLCVYHGLVRMYDYVIMHAEKLIEKKLQENGLAFSRGDVDRELDHHLVNVYNHDDLTPFTLAASEGRAEMFRHLMRLRTTMLWHYGPVDCSVIKLATLDTIQISYLQKARLSLMKRRGAETEEEPSPGENTAKYSFVDTAPSVHSTVELKLQKAYPASTFDTPFPARIGRGTGQDEDRHGAIEWLCRNNHLDMIDTPEVMEIIAKKWERFGYPTFLSLSLFGLVRTALITVIICLFAYSEENSVADWVAWLLYIFTWLLMLANFTSDLFKIYRYGLQHWGAGGKVRGAGLLENVCSSLEFALFTAVCIAKFSLYEKHSDNISAVRITLSLSALTCWIRICYVLMGFKQTGNFVVIVSNILWKDFPLFFWVYITILLGFGSAHAVLTVDQRSRSVANGIHHFVSSVWYIFMYTIDGQNQPVWEKVSVLEEDCQGLFQALNAVYNVCIVLLMLNLLIAMMSETYGDMVRKSHIVLARERFNMMCCFEMGMRGEKMIDTLKTYAIFDENDANAVPSFEMQTSNTEWMSGGSAAGEAFEDKMKASRVPMPRDIRELVTDGNNPSLLKAELLDRPQLVHSRDMVPLSSLCLSASPFPFPHPLFSLSLLSLSSLRRAGRYCTGRALEDHTIPLRCYSSSVPM